MTEEKIRCIVMLSGGLDSAIACHLLKEQGLDIVGLHFVLPFKSHLGLNHPHIQNCARKLGVPLRIVEEGQEYVDRMLNPHYGYGKNANPCVDCRIHRLITAKSMMTELGASFIATGEILGQRPKSQRRDCFPVIEKQSGLKGLLLRPLCARHLPETEPEIKGWVDRSKLLALTGRGRKEQLAYAAKHHLVYSSPSGCCPLTSSDIASRFHDLREHQRQVSLTEFQLLVYGRHFRFDEQTRLIISRNESETRILETLREEGDLFIELAQKNGPVAIGKGPFSRELMERAGAILARYSRDRGNAESVVICTTRGFATNLPVAPADDETCKRYHV